MSSFGYVVEDFTKALRHRFLFEFLDPKSREALYDEWVPFKKYSVHHPVDLLQLPVAYVLVPGEHLSPLVIDHRPDRRPDQPGVRSVVWGQRLLQPYATVR